MLGVTRKQRRAVCRAAGLKFHPQYNDKYTALREWWDEVLRIKARDNVSIPTAMITARPYVGRGHGKARFGIRSVAGKVTSRSKYVPHTGARQFDRHLPEGYNHV